MNGDASKPVKPGDPLRLSARVWNNVMKCPQRIDTLSATLSGGKVTQRRDPAVLLVKNDTEDLVHRFGILGLDGAIIPPDEDTEAAFLVRPGLIGTTPDLDDYFGRFAITLEPIRAGELGLACIAGISYAKVRVPEQAEGELPFGFADIDTYPEEDLRTEHLRACHAGAATILYPTDFADVDPIEEDGDVYWAIVQLGLRPAPDFYATLTEDLRYGNNNGAGATANLSIQRAEDEGADKKGSLKSLGKTAKVYCPILSSGYQLTSTTTIRVQPSPQSGLFNTTDANPCESPIPEGS